MAKIILVPLDGSERAEAILSYVQDLAVCTQAEIMLLRVLEPDYNPVDSYGPSPLFYYELSETWMAEIQSYLEQVKQRLMAAGLVAHTQVKRGPVVSSILQVAEEQNVYMIAMASHGRTGLARVFYGSVAAGVLHQVDRPLLLVRTSGS